MPSSLKLRFIRFFRRAQEILFTSGQPRSPRGRWVHGSHRESAGILALAAFLSPERPYELYLPLDHRAAEQLPLLVMIHGCKQDVSVFAAGTRMNALADRERFLVLYPEQRSRANLHRCWNWFDPSSHYGGGEAAIIAGMVRDLMTEYNVDRSRIYVAGLSSGGAMATILASCYAELFAACAVHSGVMFKAASSIASAESVLRHGSESDPAKAGEDAFRISGYKADALPIIVIHGRQDDRVRPVNADQIVAQFLHLNRLASREKNPNFAERARTETSHAGYRYDIRDYCFGDRTLLRQVMIDHLAHAWSGGDGRHPYNDPSGPDAATMIWRFFEQYRRMATPDHSAALLNSENAEQS